MKYFLTILGSAFLILSQNIVLAHPTGDITFYNASHRPIAAEVNGFGKVTLGAKEVKNVAYSTLSQACSSTPTNCKTQFYVNNAPAGSATINVNTGRVVHMNLAMKVRTAKGPQQVLRTVVIK